MQQPRWHYWLRKLDMSHTMITFKLYIYIYIYTYNVIDGTKITFIDISMHKHFIVN